MEKLSIMKHSVSSLPSISAEQNTEAENCRDLGHLNAIYTKRVTLFT